MGKGMSGGTVDCHLGANADGSHHWPFIPAFNARGDIEPARVLRALADSGGTAEVLLALEIRHRAYYPDEYQLEDNLRASVSYWRQWVKESRPCGSATVLSRTYS